MTKAEAIRYAKARADREDRVVTLWSHDIVRKLYFTTVEGCVPKPERKFTKVCTVDSETILEDYT